MYFPVALPLCDAPRASSCLQSLPRSLQSPGQSIYLHYPIPSLLPSLPRSLHVSHSPRRLCSCAHATHHGLRRCRLMHPRLPQRQSQPKPRVLKHFLVGEAIEGLEPSGRLVGLEIAVRLGAGGDVVELGGSVLKSIPVGNLSDRHSSSRDTDL